MVMHRRIVALISTAILLLNLSFSINAFSETDDLEITSSIEALYALGGFGEMELADITADDVMTRGWFIDIIIKSLGISNSNTTAYFSDVDDTSDYFDSIQAACDMNWISGAGSSEFFPDDTIAYQDAVVILIRILGAKQKAEYLGGYPLGYLMCTGEFNLRLAGNQSSEDDILVADGAAMILNALTSAYYEISHITDKDTSLTKIDSTLLLKFRSIKKDTGVVTATPYTRLTVPISGSKNSLEIDDVWYITDNEEWNNLIGRQVEYFAYEKSGGRRLIYMTPYKKGNTLEISASQLEYIDGRNLYYYRTPDSTKPVSVELPRQLKVIYNGAALPDYNLDQLLIDSGKILLTSSNSDMFYDIAVVTSYDVIAVEGVDYENKKISAKYNLGKYIDLGDSGIEYCSITNRDGEPVELTDIKEWDVLHIAVDNESRIYNIVLLNDSFESTIDEISKGTSEPFINCFMGDYYLIDNQSLIGQLYVGVTGTFYLDMDERIVAFKNAALTDGYTYLIGSYEAGGLDSTVKFKILDSSGGVKVLDADLRKLNVDNRKIANGKLPLELQAETFVPQMVDITTDASGNITSIDTVSLGDGEDAHTLTRLVSSMDLRFFVSGSNFQGELLALPTTKVFLVTNNKDDDKGYRVTDLSYFSDNRRYKISAFNKDPDSVFPDVVVVELSNNGKVVDNASPLMLVSKLSKKIASDESIRDCITGYAGDSLISIIDGENRVLENTNIKVGDVIKYEINVNGELSDVMIVFNSETFELKTTDPYYHEDYGNEFHVVSGCVYSKLKDAVSLVEGPSSSVSFGEMEFIPLAKAAIYIVEKGHDSTVKVRKSEISAINDFKSFGAVSKAFAYMKYSVTQMFVVYQ